MKGEIKILKLKYKKLNLLALISIMLVILETNMFFNFITKSMFLERKRWTRVSKLCVVVIEHILINTIIDSK